LHLGSNKLTSLTEDTFKGLNGTLRYLTLGSNQISSIAERTFFGFSRLYHLGLEYNELTVLPVNVFANMSMADSDGLIYEPNGNYYYYNYVYVYLYGNPLVCRPSEPRYGYLYLPSGPSGGSMSGSSSLPLCGTQVRIILYETCLAFVAPASLFCKIDCFSCSPAICDDP
jgi:hypothetical protein